MAGFISILYPISSIFLWIACYNAQELVGAGPTSPIPPYNEPKSCQDRLLVADERNKCWFWKCVRDWDNETVDRKLIWIHMPQRCSLGSYISNNFTAAISNPCTEKYAPKTRWDCTRGVESMINICEKMTCLNGGTKIENDECHCECPEEWKGADDCGLRTGAVLESEIYEVTEGCDADARDHCAEQDFPCKNGGTCVNSCTGFSCKCIIPFTAGSLCQKFSCDTDNLCQNGGRCLRGSDSSGYDEYQVCRCSPGWEGIDCSQPKQQS